MLAHNTAPCPECCNPNPNLRPHEPLECVIERNRRRQLEKKA